MDGIEPAHHDSDGAGPASRRPRCGWCGLALEPEPAPAPLCASCRDILQDRDWVRMLEPPHRPAPAPGGARRRGQAMGG